MVAKSADRASLTVSALLAGGIVLMALAMLLQERGRTPPPAQPERASPATARAPVDMPSAVLLPPPPAPPVSVAEPAAPPSSHPPAPPARAVEPLKATPLAPKAAPLGMIAALRPAPVVPRAPPAESPAPPSPVIDAAQNRREGGALLRLLEHGKGPTIEIAWPRTAPDQLALYRLLTRCYGMRAAVLGPRSRLFAADDPPGQPWDIDRDRISGFLRSPQGEAVPEESQAFARIARHHGLTGWRPVRVFPRDVDAALLGGLAQLVGSRYRSARSITAAYAPGGPGLTLDRFRIDGAPVAGGIALAPHRAACG